MRITISVGINLLQEGWPLKERDSMVMKHHTFIVPLIMLKSEMLLLSLSQSISVMHTWARSSFLNELSSLLSGLLLIRIGCSSQDTYANNSTNHATNDSTII